MHRERARRWSTGTLRGARCQSRARVLLREPCPALQVLAEAVSALRTADSSTLAPGHHPPPSPSLAAFFLGPPPGLASSEQCSSRCPAPFSSPSEQSQHVSSTSRAFYADVLKGHYWPVSIARAPRPDHRLLAAHHCPGPSSNSACQRLDSPASHTDPLLGPGHARSPKPGVWLGPGLLPRVP